LKSVGQNRISLTKFLCTSRTRQSVLGDGHTVHIGIRRRNTHTRSLRNKPEGEKVKCLYVSAAVCVCVYVCVCMCVCTICVWKGERNERDSNFDQTLSPSPSDSTMWLDRVQSRLRLGPVGLFHLAV
jgi:hypothetical protein